VQRAEDGSVLQVIEWPQQQAGAERPVISIVVVLAGEERPAIDREAIPVEKLAGDAKSLIGFFGTNKTAPPVVFFPNSVPCGPAATCTLSRS